MMVYVVLLFNHTVLCMLVKTCRTSTSLKVCWVQKHALYGRMCLSQYKSASQDCRLFHWFLGYKMCFVTLDHRPSKHVVMTPFTSRETKWDAQPVIWCGSHVPAGHLGQRNRKSKGNPRSKASEETNSFPASRQAPQTSPPWIGQRWRNPHSC